MGRLAVFGFLVSLFASVVPAANAETGEPLQDKQWGLAKIEAPAAWATATGEGAVVAVVDTGVDKDHPELAGKLTKGASWHDLPCRRTRPLHRPGGLGRRERARHARGRHRGGAA